ncbi:hypothetical protein QUF76_17180 [Desulfobacterales bacterium HSG16]|nr:hypothetical protein [Desulfobacterales bacterium HSG16]
MNAVFQATERNAERPSGDINGKQSPKNYVEKLKPDGEKGKAKRKNQAGLYVLAYAWACF